MRSSGWLRRAESLLALDPDETLREMGTRGPGGWPRGVREMVSDPFFIIVNHEEDRWRSSTAEWPS
jgi:hypothetical protein